MKDNGRMTKLREKESTLMLMELNTKDSGIRISSMDLGNKFGWMGQCTKEIMKKGRSMEREYLSGLMAQYMRETSIVIASMGRECTDGAMGGNTKENGRITECTIRGSLNGLIAESTLGSM